MTSQKNHFDQKVTIPLLQRCILFSNSNIAQATRLSYVSPLFAETLIDYHTLDAIILQYFDEKVIPAFKAAQLRPSGEQLKAKIEEHLLSLINTCCQVKKNNSSSRCDFGWLFEIILKTVLHKDAPDSVRCHTVLFLGDRTHGIPSPRAAPLDHILENNNIDLLQLFVKYFLETGDEHSIDLLKKHIPRQNNLHKERLYATKEPNFETIKLFCELLKSLDLLKNELKRKDTVMSMSSGPFRQSLTSITIPMALACKTGRLDVVKYFRQQQQELLSASCPNREHNKNDDQNEDENRNDYFENLCVIQAKAKNLLQLSCESKSVEMVEYILNFFAVEEEQNFTKQVVDEIDEAHFVNSSFKVLITWADGDLVKKFFTTFFGGEKQQSDGNVENQRKKKHLLLTSPPLHPGGVAGKVPIQIAMSSNQHFSTIEFLASELVKLGESENNDINLLRQQLRSTVQEPHKRQDGVFSDDNAFFSVIRRDADNLTPDFFEKICKFLQDNNVLHFFMKNPNDLFRPEMIDAVNAICESNATTATNGKNLPDLPPKNSSISPLGTLCTKHRSFPRYLDIFLKYSDENGFDRKEMLSEPGIHFRSPLISACEYVLFPRPAGQQQQKQKQQDNLETELARKRRKEQLLFVQNLLDKLEEAGILEEQLRYVSPGDGSTALISAYPNRDVQLLLLARCGSAELCRELIFEQSKVDFTRPVDEISFRDNDDDDDAIVTKLFRRKNVIEVCERDKRAVDFLKDENVYEKCREWYQRKFG